VPADSIFVQVGILISLGLVIISAWYLDGRGKWYPALSERFIAGVPWGTLISIVGVLSFYLFVQSGLFHWDDPAVIPFRSWSYAYVTGMLTAGFAHAGTSHLLGNLVGTVVLAPIAEYAWSHYPEAVSRNRATDNTGYRFPPPSQASASQEATAHGTADGGRTDWFSKVASRPWVRAFVIFPAVVIAVSVITSYFALGWSLGFSGTVFVFLGFAVVTFPIATVVAMVAMTAVNVILAAVQNPVITAGISPGAPGPPSWVGVNVQAHLLGFLIGVVLALTLLQYRRERPDISKVAFATVLVVLARQLWLLSGGGGTRFVQYRGVGLIFMFALTLVITWAVAVDDEPLFGRKLPLVPDVRVGAALWTGAVIAVTLGGLVVGGLSVGNVLLAVALVSLFVTPVAGALVLPDISSPVTLRQTIVGGLLIITVVVAAPSMTANLHGMADDPVPGDGGITVADYTVTYAEDAPNARLSGSNDSGVIVVSEAREIWSANVRDYQLEHRGDATVTVGGIGWHEQITAERTGWSVEGNDSVYVVDLEHDDTEDRPFISDPKTADSEVAGQSLTLAGTNETFEVTVTREGETVGTVEIPAVNESVSLNGVTIERIEEDNDERLFAEQDGTRVLIAEKE